MCEVIPRFWLQLIMRELRIWLKRNSITYSASQPMIQMLEIMWCAQKKKKKKTGTNPYFSLHYSPATLTVSVRHRLPFFSVPLNTHKTFFEGQKEKKIKCKIKSNTRHIKAFKNVILLIWVWNKNFHLESNLLPKTQNQNKYMSLPSSQDPLNRNSIRGQHFILCSFSLWICLKILTLTVFSVIHPN